MTDKERDIEKEIKNVVHEIYDSISVGERVYMFDAIRSLCRRCQSEAYENAAKVCEDSVKKEKSEGGLGWYVCTRTPYELRDEILALKSEADAKP